MKTIIALTFVTTFLVSCGNNESTGEQKEKYNQIWTTLNLDVNTFRNGDTIFEAKSNEEWKKAGESKTPAWCYYNNDSENGKIYGKLYNWYAVTDSRNISPVGWHVPTDIEWTDYIKYLGGENVAGGKLKEAGIIHWKSPNTGATNETGFTALPVGWRDYNGTFGSIGLDCDLWCSSDSSSDNAWGYNIMLTSASVFKESYSKYFGFSVRCVKD